MPHSDFDAFVQTIAALRAPDGCPWDREQTHASIAHNMIEEAYEAVDAIEQADSAHLREELGDVLLQVVLQSQIAADAGEFTIDDVCRDINEKMIRRHPHVFGGAVAETAADVTAIWDAVKLTEGSAALGRGGSESGSIGGGKGEGGFISGEGAADSGTGADGEGGDAAVGGESAAGGSRAEGQPAGGSDVSDAAPARPAGLLDGVPTSFPALMQAQKISRKAVAVGFEWEREADVWAKVEEEIAEFKAAATPEEAELEFGDILFALVNVARWNHVDAENALRATCRKFRTRWSCMEGAAWARGKNIKDLTQPELEELWHQAKRQER